jgi:anti-sigma factor RsiW
MSEEVELQLQRLLHGELADEEALRWRRRIEAEPDLALRWVELESVWSGLELPMPAPADPDLLREVKARLLRGEAEEASVWWFSTPWSRLAAAAALAGGIGLGMVVANDGVVAGDEALFNQVEPSLAESYWLAMTSEETEFEVQP